jgi:glycosyltransferase involved in cell wall biosynthesis
MKVLHIITRMNTGGPAVFLDHLTNAISELDCQSSIAYGYCENNEADYADTNKFKAELVKIKSLHRSLNPVDDIRAFLQIRKVIKNINPDLVNTHTSKAGFLGRIAAKSINKKLPVVHTFHGHLIYGYFARYKLFIFTLIERFLARFTDAAASITKETQDSLQKLKIGRKLRWQVIRLGIPVKQTAFLAPKANNKINLLWVGRFTDIKDPFYAILVMQELEKLSPGKFDLTMVGGGELLEESKLKAKSLPIVFTGWLDKPFESVGSFDLLILTSKNEGMGLVMLEAANYNKATVAKNVGGVGEFLINNKNGFLVSGDFKDMANKINMLPASEINSLGVEAKIILGKDFSDIRLAKEYFGLYSSLVV